MFVRFFQGKPTAGELLNHVIAANWQHVKCIVRSYPELMFESAKATDIHGYEITSSPLEYALRVNDMFTLTIFQHHVRWEQHDAFYGRIYQQPDTVFSPSNTMNESKKEFDQLVEQWCMKNPVVTFDVLQEFLRKQMDPGTASQDFLNFQPLSWAYENFLKVFGHNNISRKESYQFWVKVVGWSQWHLLPRHMLKQICAGSSYCYDPDKEKPEFLKFNGKLTWSSYADFAHLDDHLPLHVCDHTNMDDRDFCQMMGTINDIFNPAAGDLILGEHFALARGEESYIPHPTHAWDVIYACGTSRAQEDLAIFHHLAEVRHQQVKAMSPGIISRLWSFVSGLE